MLIAILGDLITLTLPTKILVRSKGNLLIIKELFFIAFLRVLFASLSVSQLRHWIGVRRRYGIWPSRCPLIVFKLNANREVVNNVADNVYQVHLGLALLEIAFGVVIVCNEAIVIYPRFDLLYLVSRNQKRLRRWVR